MPTSVIIKNLNKAFGPTKALDGVDLAIEPGEIFFLLGPSGCGKTTLLRCVAGFCAPDAGRIRLGETDITGTPPHLRDTGMVFQSYALWPHMTVRANVAFGLEHRRIPREERRRRVDEALAMVRMADRADHRPAQLSGGQQQRVALARALVVRPKCLLLDEPLSNLDARLRLEMRVEIRRICRAAGLTALYVTHDQKEALAIADRLAILRNGRIEQCGRPQEVYRRPANRFVAHFMGETNFIEGRAEAVQHGRIRVRAAGTDWVGTPSGTPVRTGDAVVLSVRPEHLRIDPPPSSGVNRIDGVAFDTNYLGDVVQQTVRPDATGTPDLRVYELRPSLVARDQRQERVTVWADPEDVVVLARNESGDGKTGASEGT